MPTQRFVLRDFIHTSSLSPYLATLTGMALGAELYPERVPSGSPAVDAVAMRPTEMPWLLAAPDLMLSNSILYIALLVMSAVYTLYHLSWVPVALVEHLATASLSALTLHPMTRVPELQ